MSDKWIKCIARGGNMMATTITAADLIEDARKRHRLGPAETRALGESLMAGLLLASNLKHGDRISISIRGDSFLRQAVVDANPDGTVRGFIISSDLARDTDGSRGPWQNGLLSIVRLRADEKEPYTGTVPNVTGHLAKDLTFYLSQSEQIPSAVGLAVNVTDKGAVDAAGAFMIQVMPGASMEEIKSVEQHINELQSLASHITKDSDPTKLLAHLFSDVTFTILEERPLKFECTCSRDRVVRALKLIGRTELQDMLNKDKGAAVNCDFCETKFSFNATELQAIIDEI